MVSTRKMITSEEVELAEGNMVDVHMYKYLVVPQANCHHEAAARKPAITK